MLRSGCSGAQKALRTPRTPRRLLLSRTSTPSQPSLWLLESTVYAHVGWSRTLSSTTRCSEGQAERKLPSLANFPPEKIRNLVNIAHIDHGKSTLADRMLEMTGTIPLKPKNLDMLDGEGKNEQVLDTLKVEKERGITVRAQSATMFHTHSDGEQYMINLIDTPGHVDFASEMLRSLLPSQGAILLVDAAQGVQAQTLTVLDEAMKRNLEIVGTVNKWDLVKDDERGPAAVQELADLLSCEESDVLRVSAKTGWGVETVLDAIIERIPPPPSAKEGETLRALAFDSWFDSYRGVVSLISIFEGELKKGDSITSAMTGKTYTVLDVGILSPREVSIADLPDPDSRVLRKGMVGYITCGMKDPKDAFLGDTFHLTSHPTPPLESFKPLKSMVFSGIYPLDPGGFLKLEEAIRRLTLTDRSVTVNRESSSFLGQGFRLGFNGSLHMDVFRQRLEDEFDEEVIVTRPLVPVKIVFKDGTEKTIDNPADFPDPSSQIKIAEVLEPMIRATIVTPDEYTGAIINLCTSARGLPLSHNYLSTGSVSAAPVDPNAPVSAALKPRVSLSYLLPLSSIITSFHSSLKSISSGFASFDYEEAPYEPADLVRMNILVNGTKIDALCTVLHRSELQAEARSWVKRLREAIPRQHYEVVIQAAVGQHIVARESIAAARKDVTGHLYGGDITRRMKLLSKQKAGKQRLKERSIGNVTIPVKAFHAVLGGQEMKRKSG